MRMDSTMLIYWSATLVLLAACIVLPEILAKSRYRTCGSVSAKTMTKRQRRNMAIAIARHAAANNGEQSAEARAFLEEYRAIADPKESERIGRIMDETYAQKKQQVVLLRLISAFFLYFLLPGTLPMILTNLIRFWVKGKVQGDPVFQTRWALITLGIMALVVLYRLVRNKPLRRLLVCWGIWALLFLLTCVGVVPSGHPIRGVMIGLIVLDVAALFVVWLRSRTR